VIVVCAPVALCALRVVARAAHIARGGVEALPAKLRRQANEGKYVPPTHDLSALLGKIARFNRRDLPQLTHFIAARGVMPSFVYHGGVLGKILVKRHIPGSIIKRDRWLSIERVRTDLDCVLHDHSDTWVL
jgi:hypothetical protein